MATTDDALGVLIKAIVAKWQASAGLNGVSGPHLGQKPIDKQPVFPYCTFRNLETADAGWTCRRAYWVTVLEFEFHGADQPSAKAAINAFHAVFKPENLSLTFDIGGLVSHRCKGADREPESAPKGFLAGTRYRFRYWMPRVSS